MRCKAQNLVYLSLFLFLSILLFGLVASVLAVSYSDVLIQVSGSGTTSPAAGEYASTYTVGSNLYVTAYPASGYKYIKMMRNGVDWTTSNPGGFLGLGDYENVTVVFQAYVTVIVRVEGSGTPTPAVGTYASTYLLGDVINVYGVADPGWVFYGVKKNGVYQGYSSPTAVTLTGVITYVDVHFDVVLSWHPVESWSLSVSSVASGWHNVETWSLSLVPSSSWHVVESWNFHVSSFSAGFHDVEWWDFNVTALAAANWHEVEFWNFTVNGTRVWTDVEWWVLDLNSTVAAWNNVEFWNFTMNSTRVWYNVEAWGMDVTTSIKLWHDVEAWNFSGQTFHVGFAWPAHVPFYLSAYGTYVDFNETAYFDAFQLDANLVTFYNVSMGTGVPIPSFGVGTLQANITFTSINYLDQIGFDAWASPEVVGPLSWYGYFYGAFDPLIDAPPSAVYFDAVPYSSGTYWDTILNENLLSTHWGVPPNVHVLMDWGVLFWPVEYWLFYPFTGLGPNLPSDLPLPIMSIMGLIGLVSMFGGPLYGVSKFRKKEYRDGAIVGLIFFVVGFALFIAWLWSS